MDLLAAALMVFGSLLAVLAGVGLHRFPNLFARMHAATKLPTLGLILILGGAAILVIPDLGSVAKLALVILFQYLTAPIGAHLVGRAAYYSEGIIDPHITVDQLADRDVEPR